MPDEALSVIRYTIESQIPAADKLKPWIRMERLRNHYAGSVDSTVLSDRFTFWNLQQNVHDSVQDWEVKVRQAVGVNTILWQMNCSGTNSHSDC